MAEERIYTIPLRRVFEGNRKLRAKRAVALVRTFLKKHMKSETVKIGKSINEKIWERSIQKPPRKVRIHTIKEDDIVYAELIGVDIKTPSKDTVKKKADKAKEKREKIKEERKERKKMGVKEEIEKESGKKTEVTERKSDMPEQKEELREQEAEHAKRSEMDKKTGKA
jgi:large subunit ribosomal protein L31e